MLTADTGGLASQYSNRELHLRLANLIPKSPAVSV